MQHSQIKIDVAKSLAKEFQELPGISHLGFGLEDRLLSKYEVCCPSPRAEVDINLQNRCQVISLARTGIINNTIREPVVSQKRANSGESFAPLVF